MIIDLFGTEIKAVNLGNEGFADELKAFGVPTVHLKWQPPARGQIELTRALDKLSYRPEIEAANQEALDRINRG